MRPGMKGEFEFEVTEDMVAKHLDVKVLSTPSMIALIERSCHMLVVPELGRGKTTVGTYVCVSHKAPAPLGSKVRVSAELKEVEGSKLTFSVQVRLGDKVIGEGEHQRYVVDEERLIRKMKEVIG